VTDQIEYVTGDLLASHEKVIAHGCNLRGVMGAGVAKGIATRYPGVYDQYRSSYPNMQLGDAFPVVTIEPGPWGNTRVIYNLMTQDDVGPCANLAAIAAAVGDMARALDSMPHGRSLGDVVGIPRIGAGIGGLSWPDVEQALRIGLGRTGIRLRIYTLPSEVHKF
jgi:O-acetyl-ADP-ribose deacetylase (regulator of RNase III)